MRHLLLSGLIFLLALSFCLFSMFYTRAICREALSLLSAAQRDAQQEDFAACQSAILQAQAYWQRYARWFGLTLTHEQIDNILERFAALSQYAQLSDRDDFLAGCAELSCALSHIRQMELPTPENIL